MPVTLPQPLGRRSSSLGSATRTRAHWSPQIFLADLLSKKWMEAIIPAVLLVVVAGTLATTVPNLITASSIESVSREFGEFALLALAMMIVLLSGGIDISVGSMFALSNTVALYLMHFTGMSPLVAVLLTLLLGAAMGAVNGVVVGYLKVTPLLTTLVTLIIYRGVVTMLDARWGREAGGSVVNDASWSFLGKGSLLGMPASFAILVLLAILAHVVLTRTRYGWQLTAVGGDRRSARHSGIAVDRLRASAYVLSGLLASLAGVFYASRLNSASSRTGEGLEFLVLTAVVVGGVSLFGGRGTVPRALIGALIVMILSRGLLLINAGSEVQSSILAIALLAAVAFDTKFSKHRAAFIQKIYIHPSGIEYGPLPNFTGVWKPNEKLRATEAIGLDRVEGPEDVVLDREGRVYAGTREGEIVRFSGSEFAEREVFARIGGRPLGLAFDNDENLVVCVGGMGLYGVKPDGEVFLMTARTRRTPFKLVDDARLRLPDDCDVDRVDGSIYFSEATLRFEMETWVLDCIEGRPNGRLIRFDPSTGKTETVLRNLIFPNGVCISHDGQSVLFCRTWTCDVQRVWVKGPNKGRVETFMENLPGYPDNINRASNGRYWLALTGMRTPTFDLMMSMPRVRRRMLKRLPPTEWLYPNMNNGLVCLVSHDGKPLETYWDPSGRQHPNITSMREYEGHLYLGGLNNNRIGRIPLPGPSQPDPSRTHGGVDESAVRRLEVGADG